MLGKHLIFSVAKEGFITGIILGIAVFGMMIVMPSGCSSVLSPVEPSVGGSMTVSDDFARQVLVYNYASNHTGPFTVEDWDDFLTSSEAEAYRSFCEQDGRDPEAGLQWAFDTLTRLEHAGT